MSRTSALDASNQAVSPVLIGGTLPPLGPCIPPSRLAWATLPLAAGCAKELPTAVSGFDQLRFRLRDGLFRTCDAAVRQTPQLLGPPRSDGLKPGNHQHVQVDDRENG